MKRFSFCPVCGAGLTGQPASSVRVDVIVCPACGFHFWQNSKPAVAAILLRVVGGKRQILLTRRGIEPYKGQWDLPGGFLANGELPVEGIHRELREELDVEVSDPRFFTAEITQYNRDDIAEQVRFVLSLFYVCEVAPDARFVPADDVVEAAWFPLEKLPAELAFDGNRRALGKLSASPGAA
ncbi:MAG TPA: NUDIX hydrolase [Spirochaetia bacterium]|nr:NUDIX hydrolase [Spirochaetia bacterium]